jgi:hypothetical protein
MVTLDVRRAGDTEARHRGARAHAIDLLREREPRDEIGDAFLVREAGIPEGIVGRGAL